MTMMTYVGENVLLIGWVMGGVKFAGISTVYQLLPSLPPLPHSFHDPLVHSSPSPPPSTLTPPIHYV